MSRLIIVPNNDIRATTQNDRGQRFATIHTGKFQVVAETGEGGRFAITQEVFDEAFEIVSPAEPETVG